MITPRNHPTEERIQKLLLDNKSTIIKDKSNNNLNNEIVQDENNISSKNILSRKSSRSKERQKK